MENASKALIIAAAILLSILIIALGMRVYNSSASVTEGTNMDAQEIRAHNSQFLAYQGKKKGSEVDSLFQLILTNNNNFEDRLVSLYFSPTTTSAGHNGDESNIVKRYCYIANREIPASEFKNATYAEGFSRLSDSANYRDRIGQIRTRGIEKNTTYFISFEYSDNGLISLCDIRMSN